MLTGIYIFFYRDNIVKPFSSIINKYLEIEIAHKFYTTVFSLVRRIVSNKNFSIFALTLFYFNFSSIIYLPG